MWTQKSAMEKPNEQMESSEKSEVMLNNERKIDDRTMRLQALRKAFDLGLKSNSPKIETHALLSTEDYTGGRRLRIEMQEQRSEKRDAYVKDYTGLVTSIAGVMREQLATEGTAVYDTTIGKRTFESLTEDKQRALEEKFITGIWGIMYGNLNIQYGSNRYHFLYESLEKKKWDCDNSATLVMDVGKELGIPVEMVLVPGHALAKTPHFYIETTRSPAPSYSEELNKNYEKVLWVSSEKNLLASLPYGERARAFVMKNEFSKAANEFATAAELSKKADPEVSEIYASYGRILTHLKNEDYDKAMKEIEKTSNKYGGVFDDRRQNAQIFNYLGEGFMKRGEMDEAIRMLKGAVVEDRTYPNSYYNLAEAQFRKMDIGSSFVNLMNGIYFSITTPVNDYLNRRQQEIAANSAA